MPSFRANFAYAKGDIAPRMANISGASICGDILKINEATYQLILSNFDSIFRPCISIIQFLSSTATYSRSINYISAM